MVYIVTALSCEARPIVDKYNLKRDSDCRHFPVFRGNDMNLIVSGVGKMASAIATTYLLVRGEAGEGSVALNIGVCGAVSREYPAGTPVLIHKIVDHETGSQYFPDVLLEHPFREGSIETHNEIVMRESIASGQTQVQADFVDMEASGFFQAAFSFLSLHQIYVIKIVGDHLDVVDFNKDRIAEWITRALDDVYGFLEQAKSFCKPGGAVFTQAEQQQLENIRKSLRLTVTQGYQLVDMARRYRLRTGKPLPDFSDILEAGVKVKAEGRKAFERIKSILAAE